MSPGRGFLPISSPKVQATNHACCPLFCSCQDKLTPLPPYVPAGSCQLCCALSSLPLKASQPSLSLPVCQVTSQSIGITFSFAIYPVSLRTNPLRHDNTSGPAQSLQNWAAAPGFLSAPLPTLPHLRGTGRTAWHQFICFPFFKDKHALCCTEADILSWRVTTEQCNSFEDSELFK